MITHTALHLDTDTNLEVHVVPSSAWVTFGKPESECAVFVRDIETADRLAHIFGVLADSMRDREGKLFPTSENGH